MRNSYAVSLMAVFLTILMCTLESCSCSRKGHTVYEVTTRHGERLPVYAEPNSSSEVVATLDSGTVVNYVQMYTSCMSIELDGDTCYILGENCIYRHYVYDEDEAEFEARKGTVNLGFARVKWYWLLAAFVICMMIPPIRTVIRWITFIPVGILVCVLFDLLQPGEFIVSLILHEVLPYWGQIILDVISGALQFGIMVYIGALVCPKRRVGAIATSVVGIILTIYHIIANKQATLVYVDATPPEIDWLHTCVMLATFIFVSFALTRADDLFVDDD